MDTAHCIKASPLGLRSLTCFCLLGCALLIANVGHERAWREDRHRQDESVLVPDSSVVHWVRRGQEGLISSTLWVRTIFHYADALTNNNSDTVLPDYLNAVIAADPRWPYPFEFGGLVLTDSTGVTDARGETLLEEGIRRFPSRWKLRVYLAIALQEQGRRTEDVAAPLLGLDTVNADMPEYVRTLALSVLAKGGRGDIAARGFSQAIRQAQDPAIKDMLVRRLAREIVRGKSLPDSTAYKMANILATGLQSGIASEVKASDSIIVELWHRS